MNRRELFKKILTKSIDFTVEKGEEAVQIFQDYTDPQETLPPPTDHEADLPENHSKFSPSLSSRAKKSSTKATGKKSSKGKAEFRPPGLSFPPGALKPDTKFTKTCTGCGDCVYACPYSAILPVFEDKLGKNLPYLDVNSNACMMCEDWPCIQSCNFNALKPLKKGEKPNFGQAKGIFEYCINQQTGEKTCNACQEACPVAKTVVFRGNKPSFAKSCTGCGLCVQVCPSFPKAIRID